MLLLRFSATLFRHLFFMFSAYAMLLLLFRHDAEVYVV